MQTAVIRWVLEKAPRWVSRSEPTRTTVASQVCSVVCREVRGRGRGWGMRWKRDREKERRREKEQCGTNKDRRRTGGAKVVASSIRKTKKRVSYICQLRWCEYQGTTIVNCALYRGVANFFLVPQYFKFLYAEINRSNSPVLPSVSENVKTREQLTGGDRAGFFLPTAFGDI